jgi:translation elongation factor EF-4
MGELHIEVVKERLLREYNLHVFLGPLQVSRIIFFLNENSSSDRLSGDNDNGGE